MKYFGRTGRHSYSSRQFCSIISEQIATGTNSHPVRRNREN